MKARPEPIMSFEIESGVPYTAELQRLVADCRRRANSEYVDYSIAKLQRDGSIAPDQPVHVSVQVQRDWVSWALVSRSGHRFAATWPDNADLNA